MLKKFDEVYARIKASLIMEEEEIDKEIDLVSDETFNKLKDAVTAEFKRLYDEQKMPKEYSFDVVEKAIAQRFEPMEDRKDRAELLSKVIDALLDDRQVNKIKNGDVSDEKGLVKLFMAAVKNIRNNVAKANAFIKTLIGRLKK